MFKPYMPKPHPRQRDIAEAQPPIKHNPRGVGNHNQYTQYMRQNGQTEKYKNNHQS